MIFHRIDAWDSGGAQFPGSRGAGSSVAERRPESLPRRESLEGAVRGGLPAPKAYCTYRPPEDAMRHPGKKLFYSASFKHNSTGSLAVLCMCKHH